MSDQKKDQPQQGDKNKGSAPQQQQAQNPKKDDKSHTAAPSVDQSHTAAPGADKPEKK